MRQHVRSLLEREFNVVTATNGLEALDKIRIEKPALVLCDIMMPVMDGVQLLKEIKKEKETDRIPVVLLTARAGKESRIEGYETGADDYLVKPFSSAELLSRIKAQLDISQKRNRVEKQLKEFLMQAPAAIAVFEGRDHIITIANKEFQDLTGRTEKELIQHAVKDAFPEVEEQGIIALLDHAYSTGKTVSQNGFAAALMVNGETKEGYYDFVLQPIRTGNDVITGIMVHVVDVTERLAARKKIEESEKRFRTMANEAPLFVWVTDENLQTIFLNKTGLNYFNLTDSTRLSDLSWKNYIHPEDIDMVIRVMKEAGENRQPYTLEMRLKDGLNAEYRWFLDKGTGRYENDKLIGFIGTSLDIHDRKEVRTDKGK
jgi:PAS domain S-box-containing protein